MSARLTVRPLMADERAAFDGVLATWPHAMIYGSGRFAGFLEEVAGCRVTHLVAERDGRLVGFLPFAVKTDSTHGTVVNSLPWYGSHGGCWLRDAGDGAVREALLAAYGSELKTCDPLFSVVILSHVEEAEAETYNGRLDHNSLDHRIGQVTELLPWQEEYEEALFGVLRQKTRNLIRKSLKQGFEERVGDHDACWRFLYRTHCDNMLALSGRAKPWSHFDALRRRFRGDGSRLSLACLDGEPVAALLLLMFGRTVEYLVPAIVQERRAQQPLSFLIWNAMLDCAHRGFRVWNWGGTWPGQEGLHHFKAGWGARDHPYSYLVRSREHGLTRFLESPDDLMEAFPYFYLYPLRRDDERDTA